MGTWIVTRKTAGWCGLIVVGAGFWAAPLLWSQRPEGAGPGQPPPPAEGPFPGGPPGGGFPGGGPPGGPGGFRFPLDPVTAALDTDGNRELSSEELAKAAEILKTLDKNKDGKLTQDEVAPAFPMGGFGGGRGPMGGQERKILKDYDKDGNGYLTKEERAEARKNQPAGGGRGFGGPGGPGGFGRSQEPPQAGPRMTPADVKSFPDAALYDTSVVRTLFFTFENEDWEKELEAFHNTDVEVPATLVVDGKEYPGVGVHFRGMSSYGMVSAGFKRSLNVAVDLVDSDQKLYGYKTLNLLNSNGDSTLLSSVLYSQIANQYIPAPRANLVKVVINGEYWGVYVNVQQFNKDFLKENFSSSNGARWKVSGSPGGDGGLRYLGEDLAEYKNRFEIKSKDEEASWKALVNLCKVLNETPADQLEAALAPILDIDGALKFLALDCALVNSDGYWTRASDYSLYLDEAGRFHVIPHDMNEAFHGGGPPGGFGGPRGGRGGERASGGPPRDEGQAPPPRDGEPPRPEGRPADGPPGGGFGGFGPPGGGFGGFGPPGGGPGGMMHGGVDLDPLIGLDDTRKPLRSKLLAVPSLRARYLSYVKQIAEKSLDWQTIGPFVAQQRSLIMKDVEADTRKLTRYEEFVSQTAPETSAERPSGLKHFFEARRKYLLEHKDVAAAAPLAAADRKPETIVTGVAGGVTKSASPGPSSPQVIISELMASNTKSIQSPSGKFADWIELYNPTEAAIDLTGCYVTDTDRAPRKWPFPQGTVIAAGGYLILWADEDGKAESGLHLNFKLSAKGEDVYLIDSDARGNAILDHVRFEKQTDDVSFGRHPERTAEWTPLFATPGDRNRVSE